MKTLYTLGALSLLAAVLSAQEPPGKTLPTRTRCRQTLSVKPWAKGLKQIPSTVIDKGVLKNVPYTSYRAGEYELNIYGDPDAPACFEIGVNGALVSNLEARRNCYDVVSAILNDSGATAFLKSLKPEGDKKVRGGVTYEITPPTAEDAYGGWWISIYSEPLLDKSRASAEEMATITTTRKDVKKVDAAPAPKRPASAPAVDPVLEGRWGSEDLSDARKVKDVPEEQQAVYKPAIAKKDGVYVTTRTLDDTGYILFVCANSPKHEDREEIIRTCPACGKVHTFWWNKDESCFVGFTCGQPFDNAKIKCSLCGATPKKVRIKHE
ncbi:MAG TPA: hypothetical protein VKW04_13205 [Planctomycetota bacterium]|nr:hypothetical protein [Planctomycetota bacterium]